MVQGTGPQVPVATEHPLRPAYALGTSGIIAVGSINDAGRALAAEARSVRRPRMS
jgi:hypothetical protein